MEKTVFHNKGQKDFFVFRASAMLTARNIFTRTSGLPLEKCGSVVGATFVAVFADDRYNVTAMLERGASALTQNGGAVLFSFPASGLMRESIAHIYGGRADYFCLRCRRVVASTHRCDEIVCANCGAVLKKDELGSVDFFGAHLCKDCAEHRLGRRLGYHDRPVNIAVKQSYTARQKTPVLGIEVELDGTCPSSWDAVARDFSRVLNPNPCKPSAYFNRDGSLYDGGVEVISLPLTARDLLLLNWDGMFEKATAHGLSGGCRCGIHIHCDRHFFGENNSNKNAVLLFAYINRYAEQFERIFGRSMDDDECGYNRKLKKDADLIECSLNLNSTRYWCVNNQNNRTIELRSFASTTDGATLRSYVDIAQALFRWAKRANPVSPCRDGFGKWCQYLKSKKTLAFVCEKVNDDEVVAQCEKWYNHTHATAGGR